MKTILSLLVFCALSPAALAQGGGFSDLLRSVTGAISGKEAAPAQKSETAVLGVRGMDEADAKTSAPAAGDVKLLESWAVGRTEAEAAAARRGLAARPVTYE